MTDECRGVLGKRNADSLGDSFRILDPRNNGNRGLAGCAKKFAGWFGGSIDAGLNTMQDRWVTLQEYQQEGPRAVLRKCFPSYQGINWKALRNNKVRKSVFGANGKRRMLDQTDVLGGN